MPDWFLTVTMTDYVTESDKISLIARKYTCLLNIVYHDTVYVYAMIVLYVSSKNFAYSYHAQGLNYQTPNVKIVGGL